MGPFTPVTIDDYNYISKVTDEYTKWTAVYWLINTNQALQSLRRFVDSTIIPSGGRIVDWRVDKSGEYTGGGFDSTAWRSVLSKNPPPPTRLAKSVRVPPN